MGGSGGGSSFRLNPSEIDRLREDALRRLEQRRLDGQINALLQHELAEINDRDTETVNQRLDQIEEALRDEIDGFDRVLFGGSVAKHTYVDGLSDIDSLVILEESTVGSRTPKQMRSQFRDILARQLNMADVATIETGRMAVTVNYRDGTQIQILPAVQRGDEQAISSASGDTWVSINPREFSDRLAQLNKEKGGAVIPAIKLAKAILASQLPEEARPTGYHIEALAVAAFEQYEGARTPKATTEHFFASASRNVLRPVPDITGQSRHVDDSLGGADSAERRTLARALGRMEKAMRTATSVADWRSLLSDG